MELKIRLTLILWFHFSLTETEHQNQITKLSSEMHLDNAAALVE